MDLTSPCNGLLSLLIETITSLFNMLWPTTSALHDHWKKIVLDYVSDPATLGDLVLFQLIALGSLYVFNRGSLWGKAEEFHPKLFERPQLNSPVTERPKKSRHIQQAAEEIGARVVLLWGSQSGFAEGLAHSLAQDLQQRFGIRSLLADLSDFDAQSVTGVHKSLPVIFIVSTYGEGDPTDNAQEFFSWSKTADHCLKNLFYAAFGCGNSNYQNYNKVVDDLQALLESTGATAIVPTGKGDEAARTAKEDFMDWKEDLAAALCRNFGFLGIERKYEPSVEVAESETFTAADCLQLGSPCYQLDIGQGKKQSKIIKLPIVSRTPLAQYDEHNRSCIEVVADLSSYSNVKYKTGDHIAVWPENPAEDVQMILQLLGLYEKRDTAITISPRDGGAELKMPSRTTIDALFRHHLDICGPVSRETVLGIARMAPTSLIKDSLSAMTTSKATFLKHLTTNHLSCVRILQQTIALDPSASWEKLSLPFVIDNVGPMIPRLYSISSSATTCPRQVSLTVTNKATALANNPSMVIPGLASTFLTGPIHSPPSEHNPSGASTIYAQIRQTTFKLPVNASIPIILVAAGSGIAPFRAFIQERARLKSVGRDVARTILFFGCQGEHDFLYRDEFDAFMKGPLAGILQVVPAFSRTGPKKRYVQDMVKARCPDVCDLLLNRDAAIYVCGSAVMARQVNQTIRSHIMEERNLDDNGYDGWRAQKKLTKQWFEDVWG